MFCKYCGKDLSDDAVFCSGCGKRLVMEVKEKIAVEEKLNYEPPSVGQVTEQTIEKSDANETDVVKFDPSAKELEEVAAVSDGADKMEAVDEEKAVQVFHDTPDESNNTKGESIPVKQKKHKKWSAKKKLIFFGSAVAILIAVGIPVGRMIQIKIYEAKNYPVLEEFASNLYDEMINFDNKYNSENFDPIDDRLCLLDAEVYYLNAYLDYYVGLVRVKGKNADYSEINADIECTITMAEGDLNNSSPLGLLYGFFNETKENLSSIKNRWKNIKIGR